MKLSLEYSLNMKRNILKDGYEKTKNIEYQHILQLVLLYVHYNTVQINY